MWTSGLDDLLRLVSLPGGFLPDLSELKRVRIPAKLTIPSGGS
jgi:hypothetical protein